MHFMYLSMNEVCRSITWANVTKSIHKEPHVQTSLFSNWTFGEQRKFISYLAKFSL